MNIIMVDGAQRADEIRAFNALFPDAFLPLKPRHLDKTSFWWLVKVADRTVGFAGMVPFLPFPRVGYLKRAAVLPEYRGQGLQKRFMETREKAARDWTDWTHLVSECEFDNIASANNFIRAGFKLCEAERPWAETNSLYWIKPINRS
jgi:GNAT superfamily N-acetyltransferase